MEYYTSVNDYPAFGFTAPWHWNPVSAAPNHSAGNTLITNDIGYGDDMRSDQVIVPGIVPMEHTAQAVKDHIVAYQNSIGPIGVVGGGFPIK